MQMADRFLMGQTFWKKRVYILDRQTGRKVFPSDALLAKFGDISQAIRPDMLTHNEYTFVCGYVSLRFAGAALQPGTYIEQSFLDADPDKMVMHARVAFHAEPPNL